MNHHKSFVLSIAIALSPYDQRESRTEQWVADLRDAEELGIPRWSITTGALLTAATSTHKRQPLVRDTITESGNIMEFSKVRSRPPAMTQLQCVAEAQSLLKILDQAVPLVESAEALIAKLSAEERPTSDNARDGLRLRLRFVELLGPLNELRCPEHADIRNETARFFTFYLHMITRSFEVRFSTLGRTEYEIVNAPSTAPTRYARLLGLRASLVESLEDLPELRAEDSPATPELPAPGEVDRRIPFGLIALGLIVVVLSILAVIWQSSAAQKVSFTCGDLGCQASDPGLYFLTTAALLFAPTLLAAGAISAVISFGMTRLLVSKRLSRKPATANGAWLRFLPMAVSWAPGIVLTAVSAIAMLYISQASKSPGALCLAGSCTDEYAFTETLHTLAPAGLLTGITCLLVVALGRALPRADVARSTPYGEPAPVRSVQEPGMVVGELEAQPRYSQTDAALFMRPTDGPNSDAI
ncbi:hypothetical protein [Subtercola endophyticus]|uniref:hypothetical protein n=1 Tax=Subtercola endophyticus TaxID=2895559 RepID=UPI001E41E69F|nr:hypothetical protein [Subtercola endophyticus]UFS58190.1 hypothetical protein LQ955_14355 [Subtercola endophyticus]